MYDRNACFTITKRAPFEAESCAQAIQGELEKTGQKRTSLKIRDFSPNPMRNCIEIVWKLGGHNFCRGPDFWYPCHVQAPSPHTISSINTEDRGFQWFSGLVNDDNLLFLCK